MNNNRVGLIQQYIKDNIALTNVELARKLNVSIDTIKYHIRKLGLQGARKRGKPFLIAHDEYIRQHFPLQSASIIAKALGISKNTVLQTANRLGVKHLPDYAKSKIKRAIRENLEGQRFGRLIIRRQLGLNQYGQMRYECVCDCGNIAVSTAGNLKNGHMKSCGCYRREFLKEIRSTRKST